MNREGPEIRFSREGAKPAAAQALAGRGRMTAENPNREVREVFDLTGFDGIFTIRSNDETD